MAPQRRRCIVTAKQAGVKKYIVKLSDEERERECPANGGMTTQGVRSVGSIADRGNGDAMGVAVDCDGG
jgi:hypothetical protein